MCFPYTTIVLVPSLVKHAIENMAEILSVCEDTDIRLILWTM